LSTSSDLHNCPGTSDNPAKKSQDEVKAGKSHWTAAKLVNKEKSI
jgi:hypothetical protein